MNVKKITDLLRFSPNKMQKINLFQNKRLFCDIYCLEPGQKQVIHSHLDSDKIYYVIEGLGNFTIGAATRLLRSGEITHAPSGQPHGVENNSADRLVCLVVMAPHPSPKNFR
tara:strand:+ start:271 stop:606 length:336 start_codon:yes stop_codon:yes gene_type:complete